MPGGFYCKANILENSCQQPVFGIDVFLVRRLLIGSALNWVRSEDPDQVRLKCHKGKKSCYEELNICSERLELLSELGSPLWRTGKEHIAVFFI
jgi:hypothetical protein